MTHPYAEVIGDPIAQSKSPIIHNFWLEKLGIDADYRATRVTIPELADYFARRRADPDWRGCNVTMPLKQAISPLVERIDGFATRAGAINTVVRDGPALRGGNSDGAGFLEPLASLFVRGGWACLIGTGGAARAIALALSDAGVNLDLYGRTRDRALDLAAAIGVDARSHAIGDPLFAANHSVATGPRLLVNATSLGMTGHPPFPIALTGLSADVAVYDIVTSPLDTALLSQARAAGMRSFDGLQMLVGQAAVAFERFFGVAAPRAHDAELRELLGR